MTLTISHRFRSGPSHRSHRDVGARRGRSLIEPLESRLLLSGSPVTITGAAVVNEAATYSLALAVDTASGAWMQSATISWGDGTQSALLGNGGTLNHVYADGPASMAIMLTAFGSFGILALPGPTVAVNDVAPTASFSASSATVDPGTPVTVSFANATDISSADRAAGFIYSYDFNNDGAFDATGTAASAAVPDSVLTPGSHVIVGRVIDKDGGFTQYSVAVTVNPPPLSTGITGVPSGAVEGQPVTLAALVNGQPADPSDASVVLTWTRTRNGVVVDTAIGATYTYTPDDNGVDHVTLTATQSAQTASAGADVDVANAAPTIVLSGLASGLTTDALGFTANAADGPADVAAGLIYHWDFGDGATLEASAGATLAETHAFSAAGSYTVTVTATDRYGAVSNVAQLAVTVHEPPPVTPTPDPGTAVLLPNGTDPRKMDLVVTGTSKRDLITVDAARNGALKVYLNGRLLGTFTPTGLLIVHGGNGNDTILVGASVNQHAVLYGDAGNDVITTLSRAGSVLVGGAGNDLLVGLGRDVLIGGTARDWLLAGRGSKRIAGDVGSTAPAALLAMLPPVPTPHHRLSFFCHPGRCGR